MDMSILFFFSFFAKEKEEGQRHVCKTSDMIAKMCMYVCISTVIFSRFLSWKEKKEKRQWMMLLFSHVG